MEFFLIPLLAIAGVTVGIYKVAGLVFHIRLSWGLLAMLVGFAWLISLVLPGMFFHSAGFVGSVGISLVCAVGFAFLATVYDGRTHAAPSDDVSIEPNNSIAEVTWTPAAETAFPVSPGAIDAQEQSGIEIIEPPVRTVYAAEPEVLPVTTAPEQAPVVALMENEPVIEAEEYLPVSTEDYYPPDIIIGAKDQRAETQEELTDESSGLTIDALVEEPKTEPTPPAFQAQILPEPAEQPVSDSLEDLLEFAFEQRNRRNMAGALDAFRLIRMQYGSSEAVPMVVAELVSTMQSSGDYGGALAELAQALQLPSIQSDSRLVHVFSQKQKYLQVLQDLLREHGSPNLPFEQIPAEWSEWLEWKLSANTSVQS